MRFVTRNKNGAINAVLSRSTQEATEGLEDNHPDLVAWDAARAAERMPPRDVLAEIDALKIKIATAEAEINTLKGSK